MSNRTKAAEGFQKYLDTLKTKVIDVGQKDAKKATPGKIKFVKMQLYRTIGRVKQGNQNG